MSTLDSVFETLFYGSGMILGLTLFISIVVGLVLRWKALGVLVIPIIMLMEYEYYARLVISNDITNAWGMITLLILIVFIVWRILGQKTREGW